MAHHRKSKSTQQNSVRIIGGDWRGRKLSFPSAEGLRPTGDRVRETLFNWLMADIVNANVVDLFAGSGALGFEALSRGAKQVSFIELNPQVCRGIEQNIKRLNVTNAHLRQQAAQDFIRSAPADSVDLMFVDPPFAQSLHEEVIALIDEQNIIKDGGHLYIESPAQISVALPPNWTCHREKTSGEVRYMLLRRQQTTVKTGPPHL